MTEQSIESEPVEQLETAVDNGCADAIAALAFITIGLLSVIHCVYTGGLPAFLGHIF